MCPGILTPTSAARPGPRLQHGRSKARALIARKAVPSRPEGRGALRWARWWSVQADRLLAADVAGEDCELHLLRARYSAPPAPETNALTARRSSDAVGAGRWL
ncbi:hypothetical protein BRM22_22420 [Xanthomonas oryzae pv. oryzae]|nr:hypothetical protein BRM60_15560 [Xanthomonas oryzae pv. oryzae]AXM14093.1 hypothetical protein BRN32_15730 [Xanthomonas oryzae pv. oryzae]AXM17797.1 hypothetical protein BRN66_15245 [Xanthomonas oryzae pv. oryzae]AXM21671.1 hypothetical protein BRM88_15890 [Xanthomonas oryzae pv. oryzae]AXM24771.1 hypothetical protein BRM77_10375 [Xanthomonas oryzae pv. oryzae]